MVDDRTTD